MRPVGVLALQGDYAEHQATLARLGAVTVQVRRPEQLQGLSGIVLPGGESSTMLRLLALQHLREPLYDAIAAGLPTLATCAGMILLATKVVDPEQPSLGLLDLTVARNGYGRQIHSGTFDLRMAHAEGLPRQGTGVFIRAPRVLSVGADVEVLAWRDEDPVLVRQGRVLAACFHPELEQGHFVTRMWLEAIGSAGSVPTMQSEAGGC